MIQEQKNALKIILDEKNLEDLHKEITPKLNQSFKETKQKDNSNLPDFFWLFIGSSLETLKRLIEDPKEKNISWKNPSVTGVLNCNINEDGEPVPLDNQAHAERIKITEDFIPTISIKTLELRQILLLRILTQDVYITIDNENGVIINSRKKNIIKKEVDLNNFDIKSIIIPVNGNFQKDNTKNNIELEIKIIPQPLTIDYVNKKIFFKVQTYFKYLNKTKDIVTNPDIWTDEYKNQFWDSVIKTIKDKNPEYYNLSYSTEKDITPVVITGKFKQSGHFVDQKLKHNFDKDKKQITLFDILETPKLRNEVIKDETIVIGIRLTQAEDKLVNTVIKLLNKKSYGDYNGNLPAEKKSYGEEREYYPKLRITPAELYKEYTNTDNYSGKDALFVKETLISLQNKNFLIIYRREKWIENKKGEKEKRISRIEEYQPLIKVITYYDNLTEKEDINIKPGQVISENGEVILELNPVFTDQIDTKFIEYPSDINELTALASGGSRNVTESNIRIRDYLMRAISAKDEVAEIDLEKLPYILGLDKYIKEKRKKRINQRIEEAIKFSKNIGLTKEVRKETGARGQYKYVFVLNTDFNK